MFEQLGTPVAVYLKKLYWRFTGLEAHGVYLATEHVNSESGETKVFHQLIDAHWQENTARDCAGRWSTYYDVPVKAFVNFRGLEQNAE